jgi:cytochrome c oxidase cbb3-type subunit 3
MSSPCPDCWPQRLRLLALALLLLASGCEREERSFGAPPSKADVEPAIRLSDIEPGHKAAEVKTAGGYEENAYEISQGKRWYKAYNCSGCHAQGGGDSGPALMDDKWIYGGEPAQIFATIRQGRPNGMPSFGGHIPEEQIWQLAAYVRSMSGQLATDDAPGRSDDLQGAKPEQRRDREALEPAHLPSSSQQ